MPKEKFFKTNLFGEILLDKKTYEAPYHGNEFPGTLGQDH